CTALVDVSGEEVEIDLMIGRSLVFSRAAPVPMADDDTHGREQVVRTVVVEVMRSIHSFHAADPGVQVAAVLVAGEWELAGDVAKALGKRVDVPCEIFDPAGALALPAGSNASAFSAVLGSAMIEPRQTAFDFLHPKRTSVRTDARKIRAAVIAAVGLAGLVGIGLAGWAHLNTKSRQAAELARQAAAAEKVHVGQLIPLVRRVERIEAWQAARINWLDHWENISRLFPPATDANITRFAVNAGSITFTARTKQRETIDSLQAALEQVPGYKVRVAQLSMRKDPLALGYDYESDFQLTVDPAVKVALPDQPATRPADDDSENRLHGSAGLAERIGGPIPDQPTARSDERAPPPVDRRRQRGVRTPATRPDGPPPGRLRG
ncbi:MAG: hypothetical protein HQ546_05800, partial [Planctomycetes bacterium]|nr:hypothetical protein [Planctomycetota bacterium]